MAKKSKKFLKQKAGNDPRAAEDRPSVVGLGSTSQSANQTNLHFTMELLPFVFFAGYMLLTLGNPPVQSFDEFHYIPAAKELFTLHLNRNFEHPPLGKYLLGLSWYVFNQATELLTELASFRIMTVTFGLILLAAFRKWMQYFKFSAGLSLAAVWTVGFNMIWFVQSKTAMLDVFYIAFGLWGLYFIATAQRDSSANSTEPGNFKRLRAYGGWAFIGLAMGSKWSALPYAFLGLWLSRRWGIKRILATSGTSLGVYFALFLPFTQLSQNPVPFSSLWDEPIRMLEGLKSTSERVHSYRSSWWEWPTLHRPMWYTFSKIEAPADGRAAFYTVFMGGNPLLFWLGGIAVLMMTVLAAARKQIRNDKKTLIMLAFFYLPFLLWILTPRKLMYFYYIMPSSFWYGPILFLALRQFVKEDKLYMRIVWTFVCLEGLIFFYMLPVLDGRALPSSTFMMFYQSWMFRLNWI